MARWRRHNTNDKRDNKRRPSRSIVVPFDMRGWRVGYELEFLTPHSPSCIEDIVDDDPRVKGWKTSVDETALERIDWFIWDERFPKMTGPFAIELISPVLTGSAIRNNLDTALGFVRDHGMTGPCCGLHVHISCDRYDMLSIDRQSFMDKHARLVQRLKEHFQGRDYRYAILGKTWDEGRERYRAVRWRDDIAGSVLGPTLELRLPGGVGYESRETVDVIVRYIYQVARCIHEVKVDQAQASLMSS